MPFEMLALSGIMCNGGVTWLIRKPAKLVRILGNGKAMGNGIKVVLTAIEYPASKNRSSAIEL